CNSQCSSRTSLTTFSRVILVMAVRTISDSISQQTSARSPRRFTIRDRWSGECESTSKLHLLVRRFCGAEQSAPFLSLILWRRSACFKLTRLRFDERPIEAAHHRELENIASCV